MSTIHHVKQFQQLQFHSLQILDYLNYYYFNFNFNHQLFLFIIYLNIKQKILI